jgi:hypothetical protein
MKKTLIFLFFLGSAALSTAQVTMTSVDNATMSSFSKSDELKRALTSSNSRQATGFDNRYEASVQGTPFLFTDWLDGTLILSDSAVVRDKMKYKFEALNNTIWVKMGTGEERILYNKELLSLELKANDGTTHLIKKVKLPNIAEKNHFSIVLFESENYTLVKDIKKAFRKANLEDKGIVTVGKAYDWFEEEVKYFLKRAKVGFEEINLKKSKLLSLMPKSHEKIIEKFCKDNAISSKLKDAEAVKLLTFINGLK